MGKPELSTPNAGPSPQPAVELPHRPTTGNGGACASSQDRGRHEHVFQNLIDQLTQCAVFFLDLDDRIIYSNPVSAAVLGYAAADFDGLVFPSLLRAGAALEKKWQWLVERTLYQDSAVAHDWLRRRDGGEFYALLEVLALRDESGVLQGRCIFLRDEGEKRKIQEELKEKESMAALGTATAMLAHEIRNPLNGMSTTVQFLERALRANSNPSKAMIVDTVHDLKSEIGRLQALLNDFHALSHPQQVQCRLVDLQALVRGLIGLLLQEAEKVKIVERFDAGVPAIRADADKLKQVFLNLIKNSFEAMPRGGTLTARCYVRETNVCVEIADTGQGIPADLNVFDLFRSTKPNGTGLGLAIARQIVEAHSGRIEYSSAPGAGTTFRVILPFRPQSS